MGYAIAAYFAVVCVIVCANISSGHECPQGEYRTEFHLGNSTLGASGTICVKDKSADE